MSITRAAMRTRVGRRLGDSSSYATAFYNDIIDAVTMSRAGMIVRYSPNYYVTHTDITGVDDATDSTYEFYECPENFRAFIKLERRFGSGSGVVYQNLRTVNAEEQDRYRLYSFTLMTLPDSIQNYEQVVSIWNGRIRIIPAPTTNSYLYRMVYLRRPIVAAADESLLDVPEEWGEVIALDSAIRMMSQVGDPLVAQLYPLLQTEEKMLKDEFRRQTMDTEGLPYLDNMR